MNAHDTRSHRTRNAGAALAAFCAGLFVLLSFGSDTRAWADSRPDTRVAEERAAFWPSADILKRDPNHPLFDTRTIDGVLYVETIGRGFIPTKDLSAYRIDAYYRLPGDDVFTASIPVDVVDDLVSVESIIELFFSTRLEPGPER